jgi:hypothetical protein
MLADTRTAIFDHLAGWPSLADVPVLGVLPDDINEVPCVVVGRPSLSPSPEVAIDQIDTGVFVVGRRINDTAAQPELEQLADQVLLALYAPLVAVPGGAAFELRADPQTVTVAALEHPCYLVTVSTPSPQPCG